MEDNLIMSKKELERKSLLEAYICRKLNLNDVAIRMGVSYRQVKRIWRKYRILRDQGLQHQNRGKVPRNAYPESFKDKVLKLYQQKYYGFGPTFAAEKLLEDDHVFVHPETLRLWLKKAGLWTRKRKRQVYRERRERRPCFGDLLQIDGSIHRWLEGSEENSCLLNIVDDATGICLAMLDKGETTKVLLLTFWKWIELYGIPKAVYVDLKSVYVSAKQLKEKYDDDLLIQDGFSVFEQACKALNIQIIRAYSPQAKGRVERKHAVFQDRFAKELLLYEIKTLEQANMHLINFIIKINNKFAKQKEEVPDSHRDASLYGDLNQILCWKYRRQVRNDWTIQFKREYYQIEKGYEKILHPEAFIIIKKYLDGTMRFWYDDVELHYHSLRAKPEPPSKSRRYRPLKGPISVEARSRISRQSKTKSPWSRFNANWLTKKKSINDNDLWDKKKRSKNG